MIDKLAEIKNIGKAWLIIENPFGGTQKLVSIINPKRSEKYVSDYVSQMCIDKNGSIREKISYKKGRLQPFEAIKTLNSFSCGDDPVYRVHCCHKLSIKDCTLTYTYYRNLINSNGDIIFENKIPKRKEITDTVIIERTF
jgi:hypothetical protein